MGDKLNVFTIFEMRTLFLFLENTYRLYRKHSNHILWFPPVKYPWTRLFPRKTFISLASNMGAPSYTVNIATDGIDNWSMRETSIPSASRHLTSKCQVHFIYIERTWMCISLHSKQQLLDITERTLKLVLFAFVFTDICLLSVANLYYTGIQQSQTMIPLNGLSS